MLADAWVRKGHGEKAVRTLRAAVDFNMAEAPGGDAGLFKTVNRFRLAALYRHLGRTAEASVVEAEAMKGREWADSEFVERLREIAAVSPQMAVSTATGRRAFH